jgi:2-polyprenyl-6-methoxyphenol hydroxylase-like FAD-dependent oxidoreductase
MTNKISFGGNQAIVMGGSIAGLMVARVLSDHFKEVIVIEKDEILANPQTRKGTPHSGHFHSLWKKGETIIADYFPGIFTDLTAEGVVCLNLGTQVATFGNNSWKPKFADPNLTIYSVSRTLLESKIRERVKAISNVKFLDDCEIKGFLTDQNHITGLEINRHNATETLKADLVVDATGRGSRTPQWLEMLGYPQIEEETVKINVGYATRYFTPPENFKADWQMMLITFHPPVNKRFGALYPLEGNRWGVTLGGMHKDYPPTDDEGFLEFAKSLPTSALYEAIKNATPLTPVISHKLPSNLWRHYEKMERFPEGLLVTGDAVCSFNPIYGQGMSVSAMDALSLDLVLQKQAKQPGTGNLNGLAKLFQKQVAKNISNAWRGATGTDLRYPETEGKRTKVTAFFQWYNGRVQRLSNNNVYARKKMARVTSMAASPFSLFAPPLLIKVLTMPKLPAKPPTVSSTLVGES